MSIDTKRTPQEYEVLSGGGAESAEVARRGLSRRQLLRRATGLGVALAATSGTYAALTMFYPNLAGQFGSIIQLKAKTAYKPAAQKDFLIDEQGMFYEPLAKSYIMHLTAAGAQFLLSGVTLTNQQDAENWLKDDADGTYWLALYQVCVHLGCKVPFRNDCVSFKCPCHGSHYNIDGEYLDGPAPRSLDRFVMFFSSGNVMVNTGKLNQTVQRPDTSTRILAVPTVACHA
ncbi:MAG: plastoquinol--plastocyanin reductase [Ktedonobacterales bacterium]|jgi:cytochrome b6-f complex iron-sulfur subunit|nr:MAG: plastoquinol--plastocyanin reductase [Ktedonobacterales bacterium]